MKKNAFLLVVFSVMFLAGFAKDGSLKLSDSYPEAGRSYTFTYDPSGTPVEGLDSIIIKLYCFSDLKKSAARSTVKLVKQHGLWNGSIQLDQHAMAFYFSVKHNELADDNNGKGYVYQVYANKIPTKGANGLIAGLYIYDNYTAGTKRDNELAVSFLNKELQAYPDNKKSFASTWYAILLNSKIDNDKEVLKEELYRLLKSKDEKDWQLAQRFFIQQKKNLVADSIMAAAKIKFPMGELVRSDAMQAIYNETNAAIKENLYKAWIKKFPPEKENASILYDYASNSVANAYAKEGNVEKVIEYANLVKTPVWRGEGWAGPASELVRQGFTREPLELFKKALNNSLLYMTTKKDDDGAEFAATGYSGYCTYIADIYFKEKNYDEALVYIDKAYKNYKSPRGNVNGLYSKILIEQGKHKEAFEKIDEAIKAGQANETMMNGLKELYVTVTGSDKGYDEYLTKANRQLVDNILKELPRKMINVKAPQFTLKDLNGNMVSLAGLRGKTVVVDFWATWCGPCKASFPAMQMAVNKYKDDPGVAFIFIHTWERNEDDATENARKYIAEMKYGFQVLMDLKDKETATNKVVEGFNVSGIPTKFIIDKNGNIRFRMTGFSGGNEGAVEEVSAMIELTRKAS